MKTPASPKTAPVASTGKPTRKAAAKPGRKPVRKSGPLPNEIRLIGGQWKRTKLKVQDRPGLRPTPDRVRETLFNWLGDLTGWRCIDAFAGTGALGFEAASRGALEVRLIEHDGALVEQLKQVQLQLQAGMTQVVRGDGVTALKQLNPASMDLILLDPPFDSGQYEAALQASGRAVSAQGFVYLEAPTAWTDAQLEPARLVVHRHLKAGAVHAHLLRRPPDAAAESTALAKPA